MTADLQQQPEVEVPSIEVEQTGAENADLAQADADKPADAKPPEGEESDKKARRNLNAIQRRIDELTREKHDERRGREAAEARAKEMEDHLRQAQGQASEPKLETYKGTYDEFISAKAEWIADRKVQSKLDEFAKNNLRTFQERDQQERAAQAAQQFDRALHHVEQDGTKKFTDFAEVVSAGPSLGPMIGQIVLSSDRPSEITYYLAKPENREFAMAIAAMHPVMASREIGKLEAALVSKRVTSAPPPPKTVGSSDKGRSAALSDEDPPEVWYAKRQAQLRKG